MFYVSGMASLISKLVHHMQTTYKSYELFITQL